MLIAAQSRPLSRRILTDKTFQKAEFGSRCAVSAQRTEGNSNVKEKIHPKYVEATVTCVCGNTWKTRSTKPQIHIEVCSNCHPFYTGTQRIVDTAGQVERFRRRYSLAGSDTAP